MCGSRSLIARAREGFLCRHVTRITQVIEAVCALVLCVTRWHRTAAIDWLRDSRSGSVIKRLPDFIRTRLRQLAQNKPPLIKSGDLSSARLLLSRVAEAGDGRAAITLAGTFDPNVLKALGLQNGAPDLALARLWYERAAQLGSADAPRRLQQLATASLP
jgi:TPR repeat protein